jgi:drug/metabolite transporter (DMT)-like permease
MNRNLAPRSEASEGRPRTKYVIAILAIVIGVAGIVAGGLDDAPGAQLLGVVIIVLAVRTVLRSR